ncbi:hypothetical protein GH5_06150 [Leishmania sp. Ghana 2012 LV757]|uniref:hypothetical protein n=1 Tax=Leishmania sp. Ghana 2012 LV757 TaxID=2803181 RepID=UPI001B59E661|nr:hypothetical protein GH5_06150 [Leishmania sp. Ghana 2012 LV757]
MTDSFVEVSPAVAAANEAEELRDEALRRMEVYVLELLHALLSAPIKRVPTIGHTAASIEEGTPGSCRRRTRHAMSRELQTLTHAACGGLSAPLVSVPREECAYAASVSAHEGAATRSSNGSSTTSMRALQVARHHLLVLTVLFCNVMRGDVATQRDVYYHLVRQISAQEVVNRTVQQLSRVLRLPRQLMGVAAGGRGYIAGWLSYRGVSLRGGCSGAAADEGMPLPLLAADLAVTLQEIAECAVAEDEGDRGISESVPLPNRMQTHPPQQSESSRSANARDLDLISRSSTTVANGFQVSPNVCAILVVEKHAVFAQLLREGLPRLLPCVLLTAQGFPTYAARRLLAHLHAALPRAAVIGLVDYNPHGLAILAAYRWAATIDALPACSASVERRYYAVPALRWLGVRTAHVTHVMEKRDSGSASTGCPSTVQCPHRHHSTPAPGRANAEPLRAADNRSLVRGNDSAAVSALSRASSAPHAGKSAAVASPLISTEPFQHYTPRDTVLMRHQIERLESLLQHVACSQVVGEDLDTEAEAADEGSRASAKRHHVRRVERVSADFDPAHQSRRRLSVADPEQQANRVSLAAWLKEAREMQRLSVKCEMEALYTTPYAHRFLGSAAAMHKRRRGAPPPPSQFAQWVCRQVLRRQYV